MTDTAPEPALIRAVWIGRLGDILIATPLLAALRRRYPRARISLVTGEAGASGARLVPGLDEVLVLRRFYHPWANLSLLLRLLREPADLLLDLNSAWSRSSLTLCALARARSKAAFARGRGDGAFGLLAAAPAEDEHMLDRYGRLAALLGLDYDPRPRIEIAPADRDRAAAALAGLAVPAGRRVVLIHPGNFKKFDNRWPEERFAELAAALRERADAFPVFLAGPGEETQVAAVASGLPVLGPLPLGVTAALLAQVPLVLANATGTAHLAVAAGARLVTVLGRYTRTVWMPKPGAPGHSCAVSDSWTSCRDVPVARVLEVLDGALGALGAPPRGQ